MKKVFSSHSALAHAWANQLQPEGRASNMFFEGPIIYSYGKHYEIAQIVTAFSGIDVCFINSNGYSNSTAKHTRHVINAIPNGMLGFKIPFGTNKLPQYGSKNHFHIEDLQDIINNMAAYCQELIDKQLKARSNYYLFTQAFDLREDILTICDLFDLDFPNEPIRWEDARNKSEFIKANYEDAQKIKEAKELEKSKDLLEKWLKHEYNGQLYNLPVHLRVSKDGQLIETTKGAKVSFSEAFILLDRLRKGEDVIGYKIDGFTLIENNSNAIKIGCHVIGWDVINNFFKN